MANEFIYDVSGLTIVKQLEWQNVKDRKLFLIGVSVGWHKHIYLIILLTQIVHCIHNYGTTNALRGNLCLSKPRTEYFKRSFTMLDKH